MSKFERRNRTNADYRYQDDEYDRQMRGERSSDYNYDEENRMSRRSRPGGRTRTDDDYEYDYQGGQAYGYGYSEDEDPEYQSGQSGSYRYSRRRGYPGGQSGSYGSSQQGTDWRGQSEYGYRSGTGMRNRQGRGSEYGSPYQGERAGGQGMGYRRGRQGNRGQSSYYQGERDYGYGYSSERDDDMNDYIYDWETDYDYEGPHVGRGPEGYQRSDERIQEDVSESLMWHGDVDASKIRVSVQNGEVTLKGTVEDRWQKRMAVDIAHDVRGVKDVHSELRIHTSSGAEGQEYTDSSATKGQGQGTGQSQGGSSRDRNSGSSSSSD